MIEDVYEPLERYDQEFRDAFAQNARDEFEKLVEQSGIDVAANQTLCAEIHRLEADKARVERRRACWGWLMVLGWVIVIACAALACYQWFALEPAQRGPYFEWMTWGGVAVAAGVVLVIFIWLRPEYNKADQEVKELASVISGKIDIATQQLAPLNALYDWDITAQLIEKTVPRIAFDSFFNAGRLRELHEEFGWDDSFNDGKSVLFSQTGEINGNPFAFGELHTMEWGTKTYEGTKHISWTEQVRGQDGKMRTVTRHETLHAYVTKPIPVYGKVGCLIYGNEAAPNLVFTRTPNSLSGKEDGFFTNIQKKYEMHKLKAKARNLDDESQYTLMSNHDFELLFHADDRNDEVEFRLLFTPLAQRQMLLLLKDKKVGYGDDFAFIKNKLYNVIFPRHLNTMSLDTDPSQFRDWDLERARVTFQTFNENYFKATYFALAPLLSIPLYQQTRTRRDIYGTPSDARACFWEREAIANYHGEKKFQHPDCITENILKTQLVSEHDGVSEVAVTAYGYRGEKRFDIVRVFGGDGKWHDVRVDWIEYLPVQRTSSMILAEQKKEVTRDDYNRTVADKTGRWRQQLAAMGCPDNQNSVFRRDIISFLKGN